MKKLIIDKSDFSEIPTSVKDLDLISVSNTLSTIHPNLNAIRLIILLPWVYFTIDL
jgi:hypothetical protein